MDSIRCGGCTEPDETYAQNGLRWEKPTFMPQSLLGHFTLIGFIDLVW